MKIVPSRVLSEEVERFLVSFTNIKHKAIFTLFYSAGLRVGEISVLKVKEIDSDCMDVLIEQGKGLKDRYFILSEKVLAFLLDHAKKYKPKYCLFESQNGGIYSAFSIQALIQGERKKQYDQEGNSTYITV